MSHAHSCATKGAWALAICVNSDRTRVASSSACRYTSSAGTTSPLSRATLSSASSASAAARRPAASEAPIFGRSRRASFRSQSTADAIVIRPALENGIPAAFHCDTWGCVTPSSLASAVTVYEGGFA